MPTKRKSPNACWSIGRLPFLPWPRSASSAYSAILSLGWRVPEQISFLAYNDATWMRLLGVSAIAHRFDAFGEMIANRFAYCIEQYADSRVFPEATRSTLDMKLVERRSVRNLADTAAVYPD